MTHCESALSLLCHHLFDFAGMYPPASLSFEDAIREALSFEHSLRRPYLTGSDLVLDVAHAVKLREYLVPENTRDKKWRVAVLLSPFKGKVSSFSNLAMLELTSLAESFSSDPSLEISSLEAKADVTAIQNLLENPSELAVLLSTIEAKNVTVALEPDLSSSTWRETLRLFLELLQALQHRFADFRWVLKVRGAGSQGSGATGISADTLAEVLCCAAEEDILIKATAGLHHPFFDAVRYSNVLGFLSLSATHCLLRKFTSDISSSEAAAMLSSASKCWDFSQGVVWKNFSVSLDELRLITREFPLTIGSCSLKEPDEDLFQLFGRIA